MQNWFNITENENDNNIHIEFISCSDRFYPINIIDVKSNVFYKTEGKEVIVSGKASVWMYGFVVYHSMKNRAIGIQIQNPAEIIRVYPLSDLDLDPAVDKWYEIKQTQEYIVLELESLHLKKWWPIATVNQILLSESFQNKSVIITGAGAVWMYAAVAVKSFLDNANDFFIYNPKEMPTLAINISKKTNINLTVPIPQFMKSEKSGEIIGVLGDPNSGKSVFSRLLSNVSDSKNVWLLDCDAASPTPPWYYELMKYNYDEAKHLRDSHKVQWSVLMEDILAQNMKNLRETLYALIADMPGGKKDKETGELDRIPGNRKIMMEQIDKIIIISKDDNSTDGWLTVLKKYKLDNKVVAIIKSHNHTGDLAFNYQRNDNIYYGTAEGLDRSLITEINNEDFLFKSNKYFEVIKEFLDKIRKEIV